MRRFLRRWGGSTVGRVLVLSPDFDFDFGFGFGFGGPGVFGESQSVSNEMLD